MTIYSQTRQQLRHIVAYGMADLWLFTVASPAATYFTDTDHYEPDDFFNNNNMQLFAYAGTGIGTIRYATDWDQSSSKMTHTTGAFTAADSVESHQRFSIAEYNNAINQAIEMVAGEALKGKDIESLVINDLLTDGLLETWTSGTELTNWTEGGLGTLTQETTVVREGTYSAKLVNTASNAHYIYQSVSNPGLYAGRTASVYAHVNTVTADRVRLALTDGVTTWYSSYHGGEGWRTGEGTQPLYIKGKTIGDAATELTVQARIETGAAVTAYFDKIWLVSGDAITEYTIPTGFVTIHRVTPESSVVGRFNNEEAVDQRFYHVRYGSTPKLVFDKVRWNDTSGRKLRLEGLQRQQATLSADSTVCTLRTEWVVQQALALLHQSRIRGRDKDSEWHEQQFKICQAKTDRERPFVKTSLPNDSIRVMEL